MLPSFRTFDHLSNSDSTSARIASGVPPLTSMPSTASFALRSGSASTATVSRLSSAMISFGVPAGTTADEVRALGADGLFLSNGPGDPDAVRGAMETIGVLAALAAIAAITIVVIGAWTSSSHPARATHGANRATAKTIATPHYLLIHAVSGSSYLAIHRNGPSGPIVFQGTIARGHTEPFDGTRFWLTASDPENLTIRVGGRLVEISGSRPVVLTVTPSGWQLN